ncbi:hypothetical protein LSH36_74g06018 [Paralvinella palmiformis]|uniref:Uncharacterized protein n=1 Tax=Paralvinella palmiformis TaxID=53620 RepID=A0AAD9K4H2_9ANNE|nr:hypothetical protein LSH36_74g06018 [Paralvinella palmiformis]
MAAGLGWTIYHLIFGNWLLVNLLYHFCKAVITGPGHPSPAITRTTTNTSFDNLGSGESWHDVKETLFQLCIVYEYMLCSGMILIQTALVQMHVRHISKGETTVESVIREGIEQHMEIRYKNPYDFGIYENWKRLLGLNHGSEPGEMRPANGRSLDGAVVAEIVCFQLPE